MADDIIGTRAEGGESIPTMLAATPPAKRVKPVRAPKAVVPATSADVPMPAVADAPVMAASPAPVETSSFETQSLETPIAAVPADTHKESTMATTIENVANTTTDKAQAMFADVNDRAKGAMAKSAKMVEEMNSFGKGNVEAIVESSKIAAKGIEALGQEAAEFARKSIEDATTAMKTLASVKSPTEFMKLQSDYMRSAFDAMVAETSRSTETMLKLAGEVVQPISNRMAIAADKMKIAA
ncbi:TIGR01841 family phasin [Sphingomonas sp.]|uniref:phasin family protein n=1 Tax=Sphingomonas sp. TaxID=28214 RepID=UPI002EDAC734